MRCLLHYALSVTAALSLGVVVGGCAHTSATNDGQNKETSAGTPKKGKVGGPQLGTPGGGPVIDKSGDKTLQDMISSEVPLFKQLEYQDAETGKTLKYNLYSPSDNADGKSYPLVLFMADASTPGTDVTRPLTQGYGALVWATKEWQAAILVMSSSPNTPAWR